MSSTKQPTRPLSHFLYNEPMVGFMTRFRTHPLNGGKSRTHALDYGGTCREELIWDTREHLRSSSTTSKKLRNSWRRLSTTTHEIDFDAESLKQPSVTYLWKNDDNDDGSEICKRPCCTSRFPEVMDAFVGPLGVVLNPDRYEGNWWTTSVEESKGVTTGIGEYRWYGTDNFFLRHPVLTSLMIGMFRQGVLLFEQGYDTDILRTVKRKEVEEALTNSDPKLAMKILKSLRPWIEVPKWMAPNFPFPRGHWDRLGQLHRALYKYGCDEVFDGSPRAGWNVNTPEEMESETGGIVCHDRYEVSVGPVDYWGNPGTKATAAGKRLAKLGK